MIDKTENDLERGFDQVRELIVLRKTRAYRAVNNESILCNWEIGMYVSDKLKTAEWGSKTVEKLSQFICLQMPGEKGYDRKSLYRMVQFVETYTNDEFVATLWRQIESKDYKIKKITESIPSALFDNESYDDKIVATLWRQLGKKVSSIAELWQLLDPAINYFVVHVLANITWSIHKKIISGCTSAEERLYYLNLCIAEQPTVRELNRLVDTGAYERTLLGDKKMPIELKKNRPELLGVFKDRYMVDFAHLGSNEVEKDLHSALVNNMKQFILDLGPNFIFMGSEYRLQVGMNDFFIDLLFFERELQCMVAFELKTTEFKPEYKGQLEFYLEALDRDVRKSHENPSIGILLCKTADVRVVEYAMSRNLSPMLVAKYEKELIPKEILQNYLLELDDDMEGQRDLSE